VDDAMEWPCRTIVILFLVWTTVLLSTTTGVLGLAPVSFIPAATTNKRNPTHASLTVAATLRSLDSRLVARQIQACQSNAEQALLLLQLVAPPHANVVAVAKDNHPGDGNDNQHLHHEDDEGPYVQAIYVCSKARRPDLAIQVYHMHPTEYLRSLAISVCGKCGMYQQALALLLQSPDDAMMMLLLPVDKKQEGNHHSTNSPSLSSPPPSSSSSSSLSLPPPGKASYNAAIAACGHAGAWQEALSLLYQMPVEFLSTTTCHTVLTALSKGRRGAEALEVLRRMEKEQQPDHKEEDALAHLSKWNVTPARTTYHLTIQALIRGGELDLAKYLLIKSRTKVPSLAPRKGTIDMVIAAFGKARRWSEIQDLEQWEEEEEGTEGGKRGDNDSKTDSNNRDNHLYHNNTTLYFQHWETLPKVGQGKGSFWALGHYNTTTTVHSDDTPKTASFVRVGFQPNRNPRKNGIRLVVVDEMGTRVGFLLMINILATRNGRQGGGGGPGVGVRGMDASSSSLLGLRVEPAFRNQGWGKVLIALWIHCCLEAGIVPTTGKIHKPLIALLLEHHFGFVGAGGVVCQAAPAYAAGHAAVAVVTTEEIPPTKANDDDKIVLFSDTVKSLEGMFSPWDLYTQRILLSDRPILNGRSIRVGATWARREGMEQTTVLRAKVDGILQGRLSHDATPLDLRKVFLGVET
jgi:pentatricopeptide repeat protein